MINLYGHYETSSSVLGHVRPVANLGRLRFRAVDAVRRILHRRTQYVQAFHKLITQAGWAFIAADSVTLTAARNQATAAAVAANAAELSGDVHTHDTKLAKILTDLGTIDQQATNLGAYFDSISKLTDGKLTSSMTTATTGLLKSIEDLDPAVGKVTLGGEPLPAVVKSATGIAVAHFELESTDL